MPREEDAWMVDLEELEDIAVVNLDVHDKACVEEAIAELRDLRAVRDAAIAHEASYAGNDAAWEAWEAGDAAKVSAAHAASAIVDDTRRALFAALSLSAQAVPRG